MSGAGDPSEEIVVAASCVAVEGRAALILGASGRGKSTLALTLMAMGATLVSDDGVVLRRAPDGLTASAPPALAGLVEARGIGLLRADFTCEISCQVQTQVG